MATFTGLSSTATTTDIINKINEMVAALNGDLDDTNLDSSYAIDVSRVNNGAATTGFHLTGNISCDSGVTIDGQDVSELGNQIQVIQNNIDQEVVSKTNMVIASGTLSPGDNILSKLQAIDSAVNDTDYYIYYAAGIQSFHGTDAISGLTSGIQNVTVTVNSDYTVSVSMHAEDGSDATTGVDVAYMAIAIKK